VDGTARNLLGGHVAVLPTCIKKKIREKVFSPGGRAVLGAWDNLRPSASSVAGRRRITCSRGRLVILNRNPKPLSFIEPIGRTVVVC
jgi:hypothetical protein